jgi:hypothetical protein
MARFKMCCSPKSLITLGEARDRSLRLGDPQRPRTGQPASHHGRSSGASTDKLLFFRH